MFKTMLRRFKYNLRRAVLLPAGLAVATLGGGTAGYFGIEYALLGDQLGRQARLLAEQASSLATKDTGWPEGTREQLQLFAEAVREQRWDEAAEIARAFRAEPRLRSDPDFFLMLHDSELLRYGQSYRSGMMRWSLVALVVFLFGATLAGVGYALFRRRGVELAGADLMANRRKLEMPRLPPSILKSKDCPNALSVHIAVNRFGHVVDLDLLDGPPALAPYLAEAVRRWRFDPFLYRGRRSPVYGEITIKIR